MGIVSILLLLLVAFNVSYQSWAQSGCTTVLVSLSPCLTYITGTSSSPSSSCCSRLANVVQSQPQCLCSALNGGAASLGVTVNQTRALALPGACNVQTPPVTRCNGSSGGAAPAISPVSAPAEEEEPAEAPSDTMSEDDYPAGAASKTIPTTGVISGSGTKMTPFYFITQLYIVVAVTALISSVKLQISH